MGIIKVLKRKDGASLVVAIALGIALSNYINQVTYQLSGRITDLLGDGLPSLTASGGWRENYASPTIALILQILALELLIWIYVWIHSAISGSKKK